MSRMFRGQLPLMFAGIVITALFALPFAATPAKAWTPDRDATFVIAGSPGGGSDVAIRMLIKTVNDLKLCPVNLLVNNRPGGSGTIGYAFVAKKKGDAYTLTKFASNFLTTPLTGKSPVSYKDFTPVVSLVEDPYVVIVNAKSSIKSIEDLKKKGKMVSGSTGVVTDTALLGYLFRDHLGMEVEVVPYGGGGEVVAALLGDHLDVMFSNPTETMAMIKNGEVRPLAVTSGARLEALPDVKTMKELGYDIELTQFRGVVMPLGVDKEAVAYWAELFKKALESENWKRDYVDRYNVLPRVLVGDELAAEMETRNEFYRQLMTKLGLIGKGK